jgi:hypothetical protein
LRTALRFRTVAASMTAMPFDISLAPSPRDASAHGRGIDGTDPARSTG